MRSNKPLEYQEITGKTKVEVGDEFMPCWELYFRRLPPPYGWPVSSAPGAKFRRPVLSAEIKRQLKNLL
jgi:hypothetical protein